MVRGRVELARARQERRYRSSLYAINADLSDRGVRQHCPVTADGMRLLERAVRGLGLSMRAYVRVLRVARTIADLDGADVLSVAHVAEAVGYRTLDRRAATESAH